MIILLGFIITLSSIVLLFTRTRTIKGKIQEILVGLLGGISGSAFAYLLWKGITLELTVTFLAIILLEIAGAITLLTGSTRRYHTN